MSACGIAQEAAKTFIYETRLAMRFARAFAEDVLEQMLDEGEALLAEIYRACPVAAGVPDHSVLAADLRALLADVGAMRR